MKAKILKIDKEKETMTIKMVDTGMVMTFKMPEVIGVKGYPKENDLIEINGEKNFEK